VTHRVDQIVVFDTTLDARELRHDRARHALDHLALPGDPKLRVTGDRQECLELLEPPDCFTLLLCDMVDDQARATVGTIGARLLRSVARHSDLSEQVWRVLWSQHDHPTVITDIASYAHAFVWFDHDDRESELLAKAIAYVVGGPPEDGERGTRPIFQPFAPRGLTEGQYMAEWRDELRALLRPGAELKVNDELAAASILREEPDKRTDASLRTIRDSVDPSERRDYCESIGKLLERLHGGKKQARQSVHDRLDRKSQHGIATHLSPALVERAGELMAKHRRQNARRKLRYRTYLTEGEDELARTLVDLYEEHRRPPPGGKLHESNQIRRHAALDKALTDSELDDAFAHPDLVDCSRTPERRVATLSYAICSYNDTARSLDARTQSFG